MFDAFQQRAIREETTHAVQANVQVNTLVPNTLVLHTGVDRVGLLRLGSSSVTNRTAPIIGSAHPPCTRVESNLGIGSPSSMSHGLDAIWLKHAETV